MKNSAEKLNNFTTQTIKLLEEEFSNISEARSEKDLLINSNNINMLNKMVKLIENLKNLVELNDEDFEMNESDQMIIDNFLRARLSNGVNL